MLTTHPGMADPAPLPKATLRRKKLRAKTRFMLNEEVLGKYLGEERNVTLTRLKTEFQADQCV